MRTINQERRRFSLHSKSSLFGSKTSKIFWYCVMITGFLLFCSGCSKWIQPPQVVGVKQVSLTSMSFSSVSLELALVFENTNPFSGSISNIEVDFFIENEKVGHASLRKPIDLPSQETKVVQIPVEIFYTKMPKALLKVLRDMVDIEYQVIGEARVHFAWIPVPVEIQIRGKKELIPLPK